MRMRQSLLVVLSVVSGLAAIVGFAGAESISDHNLFSGRGVEASSVQWPADQGADKVTDGTLAPLIFYISDTDQRLVVHGFDSTMTVVRIWNAWDYANNCQSMGPLQATIKSSTTDKTSLSGADYETTLVSGPVSLNGRWVRAGDYSYADFSVHAPIGTKSLYADFGAGNTSFTPEVAAGFARINELQAYVSNARISDANLLSGKDVAVSSTQSGMGPPSNVTDGTGADNVFGIGDTDQRLVVHGFNSGMAHVRIWSQWDYPNNQQSMGPLQVTIKSSTTDKTSLDGVDYETTLVSGPVSLNGLWVAAGDYSYADFSVSAPAGTKSLFLDFDAGDSSFTSGVAPGFAKISEVQAFAPTPEPSAVALLITGLVGLICYGWRRRK